VSWVSLWTAETNGMPLEWLRLSREIETQASGVLELGPGAIQIGTKEPEDLGDVAGVVNVGLTQAEIVRLRVTDSVVLDLEPPGWPANRLLMIEQGGAGGHQVAWPELNGTRPLIRLESGAVTVVWLVWDGRDWHVLN
jgi:hypothetical protein